MSSLKAMDNLNLFRDGGKNIDTFYSIFNIPSPNAIEIDDVIRNFIKASDRYHYFQWLIYGKYKNGLEDFVSSKELPNNNNMLQRKYDLFSYFSVDMLGNLATSIKLAGEGYVYESLAILRSAIDLLFSSLFGSESWIISVNTMSSPYFHLFKEISLDDIVTDNIILKDEDKEWPLRVIRDKVASNCLDDYLKELQANMETIALKDFNKYKKIIRDSLIRAYAEMMNNYGHEIYKSIKNEITHPLNFIEYIVMDDRYTYRACKEHERNLLERLQKHLEIGGNFNELSEEVKYGLRQLTFEYEIPKEIEGVLLTCDDCDNLPVIWSIHVRFDKRSMLKYLKAHIDKDALIKINKCTKLAFNGKHNDFFGDVIDRKIYSKLNPYSHGDPKDEPSIYEWYNEYMKPFLESLSCIYSNLIQNQKTSQGKNS